MPAPDPDILADFLTESNELIEVLDRDLVALEKDPSSEPLVNSAFRAMHTIKGAGSFLALEELTDVAHAAEDVLNLVRRQEVAMSEALMSGLLQAVDVLRVQLDELGNGSPLTLGSAELLAALRAHSSSDAKTKNGSESPSVPPARNRDLRLPDSKLDLLDYMVSDLEASLDQLQAVLSDLQATPGDAEAASMFASCCEELSRSVEFFELEQMLAEVSAAAEAAGALPTAPDTNRRQMVARLSGLHAILHRRAQSLAEGQVLAFDSAPLLARLARLAAGETLAAEELLPEDASPGEAVLRDCGGEELESSPGDEPADQAPAETAASAASAAAGSGTSGAAPAKASAPEASIRVDVNRLESLLNLVGELVLEKNRVLALSRQREGGSSTFHENLDQVASDLDRVTSELQLSVMKTRMQPMNKLFSRYPRVIRDLANATGKEIQLMILGGETEVDKSVIELLADPMVHLLRNCADHGIESAADRRKAGKSPSGKITVEASHEGSHVVISIVDDGRGIDATVVGEKAIEKGLITAEDATTMGHTDLLRLVFTPGFSTAAEVTGLSGRGVGMDVVHSNIAKLNGLIDLKSEVGIGTTVTFRIPLTLAIMQAMMTEAADAIYAIPLNNVVEIVEPEEADLPCVRGIDVLRLRDEVIPLVDLREVLGGRASQTAGTHVIVVGIGERRMGLRADGLVGQQEIVIKPLDEIFEGNRLVSGATVREDGGVSLILDVGAIVDQNHGRARSARRRQVAGEQA